jgi:hypothetical protein
MIERLQIYQLRTGLIPATSTGILDFQIPTDSDAPFCLRGFGVYFPCGGAIQLRFARPDERYVQRTFGVALAGPQGGLVSDEAIGTEWAPVFPNIVFSVQSAILVQLQNISGADIHDCRLVFVGTKLFQEGVVWSRQYPPKYRLLPFSYPIPLSIPPMSTQGPIIAPPALNADADFVWQGGTFSDGLGGAATNDIGFRVRDDSGKYYMNDFIWAQQLFGFNFGERPGLTYPEIYIPKNERIFFDVQRGDPGGVNAPNSTLVLKGYKVYAQ